jgi:hypothetical protein
MLLEKILLFLITISFLFASAASLLTLSKICLRMLFPQKSSFWTTERQTKLERAVAREISLKNRYEQLKNLP